MSPPDFRPNPVDVSLDEWRFRALLTWSALLVGSLTWWAVHEELVESAVVPVPERILQLVVRDVSPELPEADAETSGASDERHGPRVVERKVDPGRHFAPWMNTPLSGLFDRPVFGTEDVEMERWEDVLAEIDVADAERSLADRVGFRGAADDHTRVDAELPDRLGAGPSRDAVMVAVASHGPARSARRAGLIPAMAPSQSELATAVVSRAGRDWRRHARACRSRAPLGWTGRVEVQVDVQAGRVVAAKVMGSRDLPLGLVQCLTSRARHLLRFPEDETGQARFPLVFQ